MKSRVITPGLFGQISEPQLEVTLPATQLYASAEKGCFVGIRNLELRDIQGYLKSLKSTESKYGSAWTFVIENEEEHVRYNLEVPQSSYPAFTILSTLAHLLEQKQAIRDIWLVFCIGTREYESKKYANVRLTLDGETLLPLFYTAENAFFQSSKDSRLITLQNIAAEVQSGLQ